MRGIFLAIALALAGTSGSLAQSSISPGGSQTLLDSYVAFIGTDDVFNSSGERLKQPWQIIRQDRANYHRFGIRDRLDEGDSFFASARNRAIMEQMLRNGHISPGAARAIVRGGAVIEVEIYGRGGRGYSVHVTTLR